MPQTNTTRTKSVSKPASAPANQMDGAQALVKCLEAQDVEYIFGYSGGAAIPIFDALVTTDTKIKLIMTRHEQGAAHMADGYARASGKPGVVLVTSGPGAGNTVTGLMTAHMDSVPIIVISGQQIRSMLGLDAFQEADIFNITMPVVKHNYLVRETNDIPRVVAEAFHIATSGRPGPVLIDMPKDVSSGSFTGNLKHDANLPGFSNETPSLDADQVKQVAEIVKNAKRPVVLAGHGVLIANASKQLQAFADMYDLPVTTTLLGKGAIDETSPRALGMLGMHGTAYANKAVMEADVLINIGSRFDDRIVGDAAAFAQDKTIVHVDIDVAEHQKMVPVDVAVHADAKEFLEAIAKLKIKASHVGWNRHLDGYKKQYPLNYRGDEGLTQQQVIDTLAKLTQNDAVVATDVGQHQMWAAQYYRTKRPNDWLSSGGAGTMGFGMPAALGAAFARPGQTVIAICGDGGFQMTEYELATAAIHKLPVKIVVLNNHYLGMVRQWQELFYDDRLSGVDLEGNPDFAKLAESYGIKAFNIENVDEVEDSLKEALDYNDGPVLINCEVIKTDNVYPMIPAGGAYSSMLISAPTRKLDKPTGST